MSPIKSLAIAFGALALAQSAAAVTMQPLHKGQPQQQFHCVNSRNQELKGARHARECKSPYHWTKIADASKAQTPRKKRVAKKD
jgi:hypothetical protein